MCMLCRQEADQATAPRAHILRLLALLEHPDALHTEQALRLGRHLLDALNVGGSLRCEAVVSALVAVGQTDGKTET